MNFLKIFQDTFSSSFDCAFLLFIGFYFQSSQLGLLFLDIATLCDFKTSVIGSTRGICDRSPRAREGKQRTQVCENAFGTE